MPSYCYECRACKSEFSMISPESVEFDSARVECVACESDDTVLIAYCITDDTTLINLSARIVDLERRIRDLEGEDEERLDS